ncbi:MAG: AAA family ATPase [Cytophagales bacterium]|nr:AAA family ATPase [Cytophagales bacterium]
MNEENIQLEGGTYEILKNRLLQEGSQLREKLQDLNIARQDVFGAIQTQLISNERITTENNCIPWDMCPIHNRFLFGYNVFLGLKTEIKLSDVFSYYEYQDHQFHQEELKILEDDNFLSDFNNLYKYYKSAQFVRFFKRDLYLYMIFRISKEVNDIKAFKWEIGSDGSLTYIDARSDHEIKYPAQHEFSWKKTTREMHRKGLHPHISIEDKIFVETIGGDLTIKVEDNTNIGKGIFSEAVKNPGQTLDDAEFNYAIIDNLIVLRVKPYQENEYRYIVYNEKLQEAKRIDALKESCIFLPEGHGLIFANGYYLQTGEFKLFDHDLKNLLFERQISSPNGEDYLYVFYNRLHGIYLLLSYNIIEQTISTPIICHGYAIFDNGELCYFKADEEAKKHHSIQIWQTPYIHSDFEIQANKESYLYKIGNKDIVKAMADAHGILNLLDKDDSYGNLYLDILKESNDTLDSHYWLTSEEAFNLAEPITEIKNTAKSAIDEFEKVLTIRKNTTQRIQEVSQETESLLQEVRRSTPKHIDEYVQFLGKLRLARGEVISLKELRYTNLPLIDKLEEEVAQASANTSEGCVKFLVKKEALQPYEQKVEDINQTIDKLEKVIDATRIEEKIDATSKELELLIEIVSNLKIEDATQTTQIIDNISAIYARFNQIKVSLKRKKKELQSVEGKAEFNAQLKLIQQGLINYLDVCDKPEKCDEYLTKLMVQLEELESKFSEFDEFIEQITIKREEAYNAFEAKKVALIEARNKHSNALLNSANRILKSVQNRAKNFKELNEINGYFASDLMIDKVRNVVEELVEIGDTVKADDIQSRLKSTQEDAIRQLKDKQELFVDGENAIQLGSHSFLVNKQSLTLTIVPRNEELSFHLTGTNFFEKIKNEKLNSYQHFWEQDLVSENKKVYRGEYLAYQIFLEAKEKKELLQQLAQSTEKENLQFVQQFMSVRYNEGYIKGVHDVDADKILGQLIQLYQTADLLHYSSDSRTLAKLWWTEFLEESIKKDFDQQLKGAGLLLQVFPQNTAFEELKEELQQAIQPFVEESALFDVSSIEEAIDYLFDECTRGNQFIIHYEAHKVCQDFIQYLKEHQQEKIFQKSIDGLKGNKIAQYQLIKNWVLAFVGSHSLDCNEHLNEIASCLFSQNHNGNQVIHTQLQTTIEGLQGNHDTIVKQAYALHYNQFIQKMEHYVSHTVPEYLHYIQLKKDLTQQFEAELRLNEFKPRVMSSFVRNELLDKVYLPIIGNNLAKQMGTAGANKRTDLMGMLLLLSPPGYGKTTLMEYIANRLGLIFMKINGPAIGHQIVSLDPAEAQNAGAKEELKKLNLALVMGDNVMLYLDDIQHCNPEFLQKFISLCDAQRKIEGVYKGQPKTYDFRGKKVAVVMAGNPYTESGDKFQIPDMLANRADIYNLGDILGDSENAFKLSYLQNCLTSNAVLSKIASKTPKDVLTLVRIAETGSQENINFEGNHSKAEINEYLSVVKKLLTIRDVVLKMNLAYIDSAAQADEYRTEPPFKLQGSYRNMNKLAERVVPIMNDDELQTLIISHYENEAQTLTTGAEANLLKFKELVDILSEEEILRWEDIKKTFARNNKLKGIGGESFGQILLQMESISEGLSSISHQLKDRNNSSTPTMTNTEVPQNTSIVVEQETNEELVGILKVLQENQQKIVTELVEQKDIQDQQLHKVQQKEIAEHKQKEEQEALLEKVLKEEKEKLSVLRNQLTVAIKEKILIEDTEDSHFSYLFAFENKTEQKIKGFVGTLEFRSSEGIIVHNLSVSYEEGIEPLGTVQWEAQMEFNPFLEKDILLKNMSIDELQTIWIPKKILF